jgi:hypothetical protein
MQSVLFGSGDARIVETPRRLNDSSGNGYFFVYLQFTESALIYISPPGRDQRFEVW